LGQRGAQIIDQGAHVGGQPRAPAGRQAQGARTMRQLEIVDVAPIIRLGPLTGGPPEEVFDRRALATARGAEGKDVVAGTADRDTEIDRLARAVLPDDFGQGLELGGRLEVEAIRGAGCEQGFRGKCVWRLQSATPRRMAQMGTRCVGDAAAPIISERASSPARRPCHRPIPYPS
jgi:hypothetical protein